MKQIVMTGRDTYHRVDKEDAEMVYRSSCPSPVLVSFWYKHLSKYGAGREIYVEGVTELLEGRELWDSRTYEIVSFSRGIQKRDFIRSNKVYGSWIRNGKEVFSTNGIVGLAGKFKTMHRVPVTYEGSFYSVSSGDAEALVLGYVEFSKIDKISINEETEYLKL